MKRALAPQAGAGVCFPLGPWEACTSLPHTFAAGPEARPSKAKRESVIIGFGEDKVKAACS